MKAFRSIALSTALVSLLAHAEDPREKLLRNIDPVQGAVTAQAYEKAQKAYEDDIILGMSKLNPTAATFPFDLQKYFASRPDPKASQYPRVVAAAAALMQQHSESLFKNSGPQASPLPTSTTPPPFPQGVPFPPDDKATRASGTMGAFSNAMKALHESYGDFPTSVPPDESTRLEVMYVTGMMRGALAALILMNDKTHDLQIPPHYSNADLARVVYNHMKAEPERLNEPDISFILRVLLQEFKPDPK